MTAPRHARRRSFPTASLGHSASKAGPSIESRTPTNVGRTPNPAGGTRPSRRAGLPRWWTFGLAAWIAGPALVGMGLAGVGMAQQSAATVEADIAFARGLASKWSFVDLAEDVIRKVEGGRLEREQTANLALLRCEIYSIGARNERNPERRNQLFADALSCLGRYIEDNSSASNLSQAEDAFISTSQMYARSLEIAIEDAIGDEAKALQEKRVEVLDAAVQRTRSLISALTAIPKDERTERQNIQRYDLMLAQGQMYAIISAAQGGEGYARSEAEKVLEELSFEAGVGTAYSLRAYAAWGDLLSGAGEHEEAAYFYEGVADQAIPETAEDRKELIGWDELDPGQKQRRFLFVELAMPGILRSNLAAGNMDNALRRAMYFWNLHRKESLDLSQLGLDTLLELSRVMLVSDGYIGGNTATGEAEWFPTEEAMAAKHKNRNRQKTAVDFALELANSVSGDANASTAQKNAAGKMLAEISLRPGVEISPAQMYEAAYAKYSSEDYIGADQAVDDLLVRMDAMEPAARVEFGAKLYNLLGNLLLKEGRTLEAAMAFREAAVNWSDPEFDEKNAKAFQQLALRLSRAAGDGDKDMRALLDEAENVVAQKGGPVGSIMFNRGKRAEDKKQWQEAIDAYQQVAEDDPEYEIAYVNIGVCQSRLGQVPAALERFTKYLEEVRTAPARQTDSPTLLSRRKGASATAEFYRGYLTHDAAKRRYERDQDTALYQKVIDYYDGFADRYEDQEQLCSIALNRLVDSYAKLGKAAAAQRELEKMVDRYPSNNLTAAAAISLYQTLSEKLEASKESASPAELTQLRRDMATALNIANRIAPKPDYARLKLEGDLWSEVQDWQKAKAPYVRLVERFLSDPKLASDVIQRVSPSLAYVHLQLREVNEAKDLLGPFVLVETEVRATKPMVQYYGKAVTGWLEGGVSGITVVPGAGGDTNEYKFVTDKLRLIADAGDKWTSCEWWSDKFDQLYAHYVWGQHDDDQRDIAKAQVEGVTTFLQGDTTFQAVEDYCNAKEESSQELVDKYGNGALRARFQWLLSKVR